jgi:hypothetical protein
MAEDVEKEGVVPSGSFDFLAHGCGCRMAPNDIESEPAQDREVFRAVVFPGSGAVFAEDDVEDPMQSILDAPMTAHRLQQSFGGDVLGQEEMWLLRTSTMRASARGDAAQSDDAGEAACGRYAGVSNDCGISRFAPVVTGRLDSFGDAAFAATGEASRRAREQLALVLLECQGEIATPLEHRCSKFPMAMQGIGGNDAAFERQHPQRIQRTLGLIAAGRLARRQHHPRFRGKNIDHLQRSGTLAPLVGATQSLSVDRCEWRSGQIPNTATGVGLGEDWRSLWASFR